MRPSPPNPSSAQGGGPRGRTGRAPRGAGLSLGGALDRLRLPVALVDMAGRVLHRTPALTALLSADPEGDRVEQALGASACALHPATPAGDAPGLEVRTARGCYRVAAIRASERPTSRGGVALVTVTCLGGGDVVRALGERFGLTAPEGEVADLLARGLAPEEVAWALGVGASTVRLHTARVLEKLGVRTPAEVAAALGG